MPGQSVCALSLLCISAEAPNRVTQIAQRCVFIFESARPEAPTVATLRLLMAEVAHAGEDHREAAFVGGGDNLVVAD